jgi:hypothetical protein
VSDGLLLLVAVDQDVVNIYYDGLVKHIPEVVIHEELERCGCIGETKRHDLYS